jgi:hypothetical protein
MGHMANMEEGPMDRHTTPIMDMDQDMGQDMDMAIIMGKLSSKIEWKNN